MFTELVVQTSWFIKLLVTVEVHLCSSLLVFYVFFYSVFFWCRSLSVGGRRMRSFFYVHRVCWYGSYLSTFVWYKILGESIKFIFNWYFVCSVVVMLILRTYSFLDKINLVWTLDSPEIILLTTNLRGYGKHLANVVLLPIALCYR